MRIVPKKAHLQCAAFRTRTTFACHAKLNLYSLASAFKQLKETGQVTMPYSRTAVGSSRLLTRLESDQGSGTSAKMDATAVKTKHGIKVESVLPLIPESTG